MSVSVGVGLAFVAMLCWGFGDFLIQRSTRKVGDWETLFIICAFGALVLFPFVWRDLPTVILGNIGNLSILLVGALVLFVAALLDFESLKRGKLSVVEPIWSFEIPASAILAFLILSERIDLTQTILIILLVCGLILVSVREKMSVKKFFIEKGVVLALVASIVMGSANFLYGWGARVTDPIMVNFFVNIFVTIVTGVYLMTKGRIKKVFRDVVSYRNVLLPMAIFDNAAWIAFAFAMTLIPIAVAVALSESYIIVAVILGLFVNRERIQSHQKIGLVLAVLVAIVLASITAG